MGSVMGKVSAHQRVQKEIDRLEHRGATPWVPYAIGLSPQLQREARV